MTLSTKFSRHSSVLDTVNCSLMRVVRRIENRIDRKENNRSNRLIMEEIASRNYTFVVLFRSSVLDPLKTVF